ncbi:MAG: hypothetical protein WC349_02010 [Patescibacteria group bacterium]|jgi:hypothetical protein
MSNIEKKYTIKFFILLLTTCISIFGIWYALMRHESVDWLSSQIAHQISPYVMVETENGFTVRNMLFGYNFNLPENFKTNGSKNLVLFIDEAGQKKCEIKHFYVNGNKANDLVADETRLIIPLNDKKLIFELINKTEKDACAKYLEEIKKSVVSN